MAFEKRTTLPGSENVHRPGFDPEGPVELGATVRVTVILRRKGNRTSTQIEGGYTPLSYDQYAKQLGASESDVELVEQFAHHAGLTVEESNPAKRRVVLTGTAEEVQQAFGTDFVHYKSQSSGRTYRGRKGTIGIPLELQDIVVSVLGLDARPIAKPHFRTNPNATTSFTPPQVAALYNYPTGVTGKGQTVAIIELGGGYKPADLTAYFKSLGLATPSVTAVSVDGGKNTPGSDADGEVMLDIEVIGAVANGANIAVYFAPNTDQGFVDAITNAAHDTTRKPSVISISWGGPEDSWSEQSRNAMNAALQDAATLGVTVTVASGDNGSTDGVGDSKLHVDFPCSSPFALACGGTTLKGTGSQITSEVVWNETANNEGATGGGVSSFFALPVYQNSAGVPKQPQTNFVGRGVPDVAGNADPTTGYQIRVNGATQVIGGTSAVAPLWAGLIALMNQQLGKPVGFMNPKLYSLGRTGFHDITTGDNDDSKLGFYKAKSGWDPCTGLGSPNGAALLKAFSSAVRTGQQEPVAGPVPPAGSVSQGIDAADDVMTATIVLRRSGPDVGDALLSGTVSAIPHADQLTSASPEDVAQVVAFANQHGLTIVEANAATRSVKLEGTREKLEKAFGVKHGSQRSYDLQSSNISIPPSLSNLAIAVLGFDQRAIAKHHTSSKSVG